MKSEIQGISICTKHRLIQVITVGGAQPTISRQGEDRRAEVRGSKGPQRGSGSWGEAIRIS